MYWKGMHLWSNKVAFGTFTGYVNEQPAIPLTGHDDQGQLIDLKVYRGKIVLLDFWFTHCGVCFEEFPKVQQLYSRLKANPDFVFYAVDRPENYDTIGQAAEMIQLRHYTFPVLVPLDSTLPDRLGVLYYPTMMVMDRNQHIIYRGDLQGAENLIAKLL
jgi:thiol-disulfide isomerase/thioredoxin